MLEPEKGVGSAYEALREALNETAPQNQGPGGMECLWTPASIVNQRFIQFFTTNIRNPNTRKVYVCAATHFGQWWTKAA